MPQSFLFQLTTLSVDITHLFGPVSITNTTVVDGYYTVELPVSLQHNTVYTLSIITQNTVGAATSKPYKLSEFCSKWCVSKHCINTTL